MGGSEEYVLVRRNRQEGVDEVDGLNHHTQKVLIAESMQFLEHFSFSLFDMWCAPVAWGGPNVSSKIIKKPTEKKLNESFCDICVRTIVYLISRIKCWQACYDLTHGVTNLLAWLDPHLGCEQEWGCDSHRIPQLTLGRWKEQTSKLEASNYVEVFVCLGNGILGERSSKQRIKEAKVIDFSLPSFVIFYTEKVIGVKFVSTFQSDWNQNSYKNQGQ